MAAEPVLCVVVEQSFQCDSAFNNQALNVFKLHSAGCNCCCCRADWVIAIRIRDNLFTKYNKCTEICLGEDSLRNNTLRKTYSLNSLCQSSSHTLLIYQRDQVSPEVEISRRGLRRRLQSCSPNNHRHEVIYKATNRTTFPQIPLSVRQCGQGCDPFCISSVSALSFLLLRSCDWQLLFFVSYELHFTTILQQQTCFRWNTVAST